MLAWELHISWRDAETDNTYLLSHESGLRPDACLPLGESASQHGGAFYTVTNMKLTITQSESLRTGERGEYAPTTDTLATLIIRLGAKCWVEKRKATITDQDRALRAFIDVPLGYTLTYGITWRGKDYDCGDMPRDIGRVLRGIEIAVEELTPKHQ